MGRSGDQVRKGGAIEDFEGTDCARASSKPGFNSVTVCVTNGSVPPKRNAFSRRMVWVRRDPRPWRFPWTRC